jgi:hypothetical protein
VAKDNELLSRILRGASDANVLVIVKYRLSGEDNEK